MLIARTIGNIIRDVIHKLFLLLDGFIYDLVRWFYDIFRALAEANIFEDEEYNEIVKKIYLILGVFMLFVLAYSLLKAIINPDEFSKGETSFTKIISNVLTSLILIALMPTIFNIAFSVQHAILSSEFIGKIILSGNVNEDDLGRGGTTIASNAFSAFFFVEGKSESSVMSNAGYLEKAFGGEGDYSIKDIKEQVYGKDEKSFTRFSWFSQAVTDGDVKYYYLISHAGGVFLLYCIIIFCFDLAVRVIKLAFYQLISPVAIICRILPGGKGKSIFSNWTKAALSTYAEVFIRIAVMYLGVYILTLIASKWDKGSLIPKTAGLGTVQSAFFLAFVVMGTMMFVKKAPKLIGDVFGLDSGSLNMGLSGLKDRLSDGGGFGMAAAVGAGATSMVRNFRNTKGNPFKKLKSAVGGLGSGAARGLKRGWNAKGFGEMKDAASSAAEAATNRKLRREAYKASHPGRLGVLSGHIGDAWDAVDRWSTGDTMTRLIERSSTVKGLEDNIKAEATKIVEKNKLNSDLLNGLDSKLKGDNVQTFFNAQKLSGKSLGELQAIYTSMQNEKIEIDKRTFETFDADAYKNAQDLAAASVDKSKYQTKVYGRVTGFDEEAYHAAVENAKASVLKSDYTKFDQASYDQAVSASMSQRASNLAMMESVVIQAEKHAVGSVVNAAATGKPESIGLKASDLEQTRLKVDNYADAHQSYGGNSKSFYANDAWEKIGDTTKVYQSDAVQAQRETERRKYNNPTSGNK